MFQIESRSTETDVPSYAHEWSADSVGEPNEFKTRAAAEAAIESLKALGDEWATAEYRVVEIVPA